MIDFSFSALSLEHFWVVGGNVVIPVPDFKSECVYEYGAGCITAVFMRKERENRRLRFIKLSYPSSR